MGGDWDTNWGTIDATTGMISIGTSNNAHVKDSWNVTIKACLNSPYTECSPVQTFKVRIDHCLIVSLVKGASIGNLTKNIFYADEEFAISQFVQTPQCGWTVTYSATLRLTHTVTRCGTPAAVT